MQHSQALRREVLHVLGDGGTMHMADQVVAWFTVKQDQMTGLRPSDIVGVAEIAAMTGRRKQDVINWIARGHSFPDPVTVLASGRIWDRNQVEVWIAGHSDLVNLKKRH